MRGGRAIVEYMTEMGFTAGTQNLCSLHPERVVLPQDDILFCERLPETGPTRAGLEFGFGVE